jgi:hypothetical protein
MARITRIDITTSTGDEGTNGRVFLGLGGREFLLDRPGRNDFGRNTNEHFVLGAANNVDTVKNSDQNDPGKLLPLDTDDLSRFPIYLRLEAVNGWHLTGATLQISSSAGVETLTALPGNQSLVLGPETGTVLFIKRAA